MVTEGLERAAAVCLQGRDKGGHAEVSLCALEERTRVEDTAAALAVVAPLSKRHSTLLLSVKVFF